MNVLPNNCRHSDFNVFPPNWNTTRASLKKTWRIEYRFYDPAFKDQFPDGRLTVLKSGMNRIKDLVSRQQLIPEMIKQELQLLQQGYNPIQNKIQKVVQLSTELKECEGPFSPDMPFINALTTALSTKKMSEKTRKDIANIIPHIEKASKSLSINGKTLADLPIQLVRRKHIRSLLSLIGQHKAGKWTANTFNRYRAYMSLLFKELNKHEVMEVNPVDGIDKEKYIGDKRETLTDQEQRQAIDRYLKSKYYTFWRFLHIFYHSGCRETEMVSIVRSDVNLTNDTFDIVVKKGTSYRRVTKAINQNAKALWQEIISEADGLLPGGPLEKLFLFNEELSPLWREKPIRSDQITKRWYRLVKQRQNELGFKVTADFYSLKHLNTTEQIDIALQSAIKEATEKVAKQNGHTTTAMVKQVYDINSEERNLKINQIAQNKFA
jgi:integrase